jgi:cytochrome P450
MNSMILAMVAYPEVVSKAQKELDAVVGDRMPEFSDMPNLPYIRAMVKEVLRWRSVSNDHERHVSSASLHIPDMTGV